MTKHPTSSRVHREGEAPDDAFVATIKRIVTWGQENRRQVTIGATAVVLVAAVVAYMVVQQRTLEQTAQTRLTQVRQTVAAGNAQLAIRDLQTFLDRFGGTGAADQARLVLSDLLVSQGRTEEAIDALGTLPDRLDEPFGLAGARLQASAFELSERYSEAVDAYQDIAANARFPYQRRQALADAARVELQHGDPQRAVGFFEQVLTTFEEDEAGRGYFEMWLAEARALARTGQGSTSVPEATADSATG